MEKNLELYEKFRSVPSNAIKPFNNGKFSGTDINTMWRIKMLTQEFGICGVGWYYDLVRTWTEKADNGDIFAFAEIELFIKQNGEWSKGISGTGGNKLQRVTKSGELSTSDECFKMSITDAFGVACKLLGLGADIYWDNDKTKYTEFAVNYATKEQVEEMRKLAVNEINVCKKYNVDKIEKLTQSEAEFVIKTKRGVK
jgi:hypothetical protein